MRSLSPPGPILLPVITSAAPIFCSQKQAASFLSKYFHATQSSKILLPLIFVIQSLCKTKRPHYLTQTNLKLQAASCLFFFFFYWITISRHVLLKSLMTRSHTPSLSTTCISNCSLQSQEDSSQYQNFKPFSELLAWSPKKFCPVNQQGCRRKPWYELRKDNRNKPESLNEQLPNPDNIFLSMRMIAIVIML